MKLEKGSVKVLCYVDEVPIPRMLNREGWIALGTGLACTPHITAVIPDPDCKEWCLTHVESGMLIGKPFPASKDYARLLLEEVGHEGLDFNQDRATIEQQEIALGKKLYAAWMRTEARWEQMERKKQQPQAQQLSLFE